MTQVIPMSTPMIYSFSESSYHSLTSPECCGSKNRMGEGEREGQQEV